MTVIERPGSNSFLDRKLFRFIALSVSLFNFLQPCLRFESPCFIFLMLLREACFSHFTTFLLYLILLIECSLFFRFFFRLPVEHLALHAYLFLASHSEIREEFLGLSLLEFFEFLLFLLLPFLRFRTTLRLNPLDLQCPLFLAFLETFNRTLEHLLCLIINFLF